MNANACTVPTGALKLELEDWHDDCELFSPMQFLPTSCVLRLAKVPLKLLNIIMPVLFMEFMAAKVWGLAPFVGSVEDTKASAGRIKLIINPAMIIVFKVKLGIFSTSSIPPDGNYT